MFKGYNMTLEISCKTGRKEEGCTARGGSRPGH